MKLLAAAGLAGVCFAASPLFAADLLGTAPPPLDMPQAELGTNWYIRGDVGYGTETQTTVDPGVSGLIPKPIPGYYTDANTGQLTATGYNLYNQPPGDSGANVNIKRGLPQTVSAPKNFDIGFGYRINDLVRVEATYEFHSGPSYATQAQVVCPGKVTGVDNYYPTTTVAGVTTYTATPYGYVYPGTTCNGYLNSSQYNNMVLASADVDLGKWWWFQPYIGGGLGVNASTISGSTHYNNTNDGSNYTGVVAGGDTNAPATWVTQTGIDAAGHPTYRYLRNAQGQGAPNVEFGTQNWNRSFSSTKYSFAGQLTAGVGIPISQSAILDIAYKFTTFDLANFKQNNMQSVSLGVRYNLN